MLSSLKALAVAVDELAAKGLVEPTEAASALTLAGVSSRDLASLLPLLSELSWSFQVVDVAGEIAEGGSFTPDYEPFVVTLRKPDQGDALQVITICGFKAFLLGEHKEQVWEIVRLEASFSTMAISFLPWGSSRIFAPAQPTKSPRELVRDHRIPPRAPADIRVWILRSPPSERLWNDEVFQAFADLSAQSLMRALAGEITSDGSLVFRGPPRAQLGAPQHGAAEEMGLAGYKGLLAAVAWVYENGMEAEQRHGLFVAEFGRIHPTETSAAVAFGQVASNVLEGARLAYQLSLSDLTREAVKAQGDLRKVVADDAAKLADNTRQVVTAVAASFATCLGLLAAKLATTTPSWVLQAVALIAAVYVMATVASGWIFMSVQGEMRRKWRSRLYRFIPESDYEAMVMEPARRSELMYKIAAVAGALVAILAVLIVFAATTNVGASLLMLI